MTQLIAELYREERERRVELERENARLRHELERQEGDRLISSQEAADLLGVTAQQVRALARDGEVPGARKVGRQWRFSRVALLSWER